MSDMTTAEHERLGYLRCNTIGHSWHDYDSTWKPEFGEPLTLRCERCGTERRDTVSTSTGDVLARHYYYPPHYKYGKGERPTRKEFRMMLLLQRMREARDERRRVTA